MIDVYLWQHIGIAAALRLPLVIVVTKIDLAPPDVFKQVRLGSGNVVQVDSFT